MEKKKYTVRVYLSSFYDVEVEAENLDDAMKEAQSSEHWDMDEIQQNLCVAEGDTEVIDEYEDLPVKRIRVDWDTDGMDPEELDLPEVVDVPGYVDEDDIADFISDIWGYCINSWEEV